MKKLAILSIVCLLAPALSAGAVEALQRKHISPHAQRVKAPQPAPRLTVPPDCYRA